MTGLSATPARGAHEYGPRAEPDRRSRTTHDVIAQTLRKATSLLREAAVPFMLGGSLACWARGGPRSQHDLDLMIAPPDAERALAALVGGGMRAERPPEEWLFKAWDGEVMIDLIFSSLGVGEITQELIDRAEELSVLAIAMPVMALEDVLTGKLLAISEQRLDYGALLEIARALREQIDWSDIWARTEHSAYARTLFALLRELDIIDMRATGHPDPNPRAAPATAGSAPCGPPARARDAGRVVVVGPSPLLTVTIEQSTGDEAEIHLHAGGQGVGRHGWPRCSART